MKLTKNNVLRLIVLFILSFLIVLSGVCPIYARADGSAVEFDKTNVLDDLQGMTLDGKPFSLDEYNFDTKKNTQILSFVEYCYSFYEEKQDNFGLYVYVYNPKGLKFDTASNLNTIQFAITKDTDSVYVKYPLTYLNKSEKTDFEGLFYKFKVNLTDEQKTAILNDLNSTSRIYKVSGFELATVGNLNATDYPVSLTFKYSGYAKGCDSDKTAESTLTVTREELETLSLDVYTTTYRPEGTNGKNDYTQDSLHSVYFAVPNKVIEQYGEMVAVHATWLNAVLAPAIVTGNQDAYNAVYNYLGKIMDSSDVVFDDLGYLFAGVTSRSYGSGTKYYYDYSYNLVFDNFKNDISNMSNHLNLYQDFKHSPKIGKELSALYMLFNSGSSDNSADSYIVSSEDIKDRLTESPEKYGGNLVNGKYSECMFESVDKEFTEVNIRADETFSLFNRIIDKSWWDKLWGLSGTVVSSTVFDGIKAISSVNKNDLSGTDTEISNKLFISQSDVSAFKSFYEDNAENSTVYLFRYQVSDYISQELTTFQKRTVLATEYWDEKDTNSYIFQETVNLDFDVIDISFSTGEVETVIPVVSSPIDVISDGTPPVYTEKDKKPDFDLFGFIICLLLFIFLLWFLVTIGIFPLIGRIILWILTAPFKFVKWLIAKIRGD